MITYKTKEEIKNIELAGSILSRCHDFIEKNIKEGMTGIELNDIIENMIIDAGAQPSFKGYNGYPATINVCINDQVVHGIPNNKPFKNGDIVTIDIGACYNNFHADRGWTYAIGEVSFARDYLLKKTRAALYAGISTIKPNGKLNDISREIFNYIEYKSNLYVVKELTGHGIGRSLHEDPMVLNYVDTTIKDLTLKPGLVICIEPIVTSALTSISLLNDNWTIVTDNTCDAAQFEHTVAVTNYGYKILT